MKYALVAILAVTIAGLGSQAGVGLPLSNGGAKLAASSAPRQVVFVDKAELAKLHPSWQALAEMRSVLARAGSSSPAKDGRPGRSRTELAARAAVKANKALDELQNRKYEALRVRSEAIKAQKMQSAEMDWRADVRGIEQTAAAQTKAVDVRNSTDLVNARLRAIAAGVASKAAGKDGNGIDRAVADDVLKANQQRLADVSGSDGQEKKAITDSAARSIDALKQASARQVAEEVRAYERDQSKLIVEGIGLARDEIARQMGPDAMLVARTNLIEYPTAEPSVGSSDMAGSMGKLRVAAVALSTQIQRDVDAAIHQLAASNGMAVVFQRRKSAPDATRKFAGFIKKSGWNAYSPVMGEAGSS